MYLCSMYSVHLSAMSIFNRSFFDDVEVAETKIVAVVVANAPGVTRGEGGSRGYNLSAGAKIEQIVHARSHNKHRHHRRSIGLEK